MAKLSIHTSQKTAILYGMHTPQGKECLTQLLRHNAYSSIVLVSQLETSLKHSKVTQLILNESSHSLFKDKIEGNDLFIFQDSHFDSDTTTTETFIQENYMLPLRIAIYGQKNKVNQVHVVTGSSTLLKSVFMPHKAKEELEQSIRSLEYWACYIYKPMNVFADTNINLRETVSSFLINRINTMSDGLLNKFVPINQESLISLMINNAQQLEKGVHVLKNEDLCMIQDKLKKE